MNAYLDYLLDLVDSDGSYVMESPGVKATGFADVQRAAMLALIVEVQAIRTEIHELRELLERMPAA